MLILIYYLPAVMEAKIAHWFFGQLWFFSFLASSGLRAIEINIDYRIPLTDEHQVSIWTQQTDNLQV
jgi:hypothetical protein